MSDTKIPFELHITTENLTVDNQQKFLSFCSNQNAKPLMIELSKGNFVNQPMLNKVIYATDLEKVLSDAMALSALMRLHNFSVKRIKIEVPAMFSDTIGDSSSGFINYFEWHGKTDYTNIENLIELCGKHKVHLSLNALRNETNTRFITLREFGVKAEFELRVLSLLKDLKEGGWPILKQQSEYCIYDNNNLLDAGWLPM